MTEQDNRPDNRPDSGGYGLPGLPPEPPRPSITTGLTPTAAAAVPRPRAIRLSYGLWLGACLAGIVAAAITLVYFGQLEAEILTRVEQQSPAEAPATQERVATATVAVLIGTAVTLVLVKFALAVTMYTGRGWARFALAPLAALGVIYYLSLFGGAPHPTKVGLMVSSAMMVPAVVLMFLPGNRAWFAQQRLLRTGGYPVDD